MDKTDIGKIKKTAEEFFAKMTMSILKLEADISALGQDRTQNENRAPGEIVGLNVTLEEPQILIGHGGQTLFEIQRLLRLVLNKKLGGFFYLNLDINGYKKKKTDHIRSFARDVANEVAFIKQEKALSPMPAYERRVIHSELSGRTDVLTESRGEGQNRHIVIKPK